VKRLAAEQDMRVRRVIIRALGRADKPDLAARTRDLLLDAKGPFKPQELLWPLWAQLEHPALRQATWSWFVAHADALIPRLPEAWRSAVVWVGGSFCDAAHAAEVERAMTPRLSAIAGGPRELAGVLEQIRLCTARRAAQEPSARAFFGKQKAR
jgi:alanyl aminopeptidase